MCANTAHRLDVIGLPPPEPFEQIMRALQALTVGTDLIVHIHREPYPLYEVLRDRGYVCQSTALADGSYSLLISRSA